MHSCACRALFGGPSWWSRSSRMGACRTHQYKKDPADQIGEQWTVYSWIEVGGFLLLLLGKIKYKDVLVCEVGRRGRCPVVRLSGRHQYLQWNDSAALLSAFQSRRPQEYPSD